MTDPADYITGFTIQEQMDELIEYVDKRAAQVAEQWLSGEQDGNVTFAQTRFAGAYDDDDATLGNRYGYIQYNRIGEGRGLVTGSVYIADVTDQDVYSVLDLSELCGTMGINMDTSEAFITGAWTVMDTTTGGSGTLGGYGTYCRNYNGVLRFGRIFNTSGDVGEWSRYNLTGHLYTFYDVLVKEA